MKTIYTLLLVTCINFCCSAQQTNKLTGVYILEIGDTKSIWLFIDNYYSQITFKEKQYMSMFGGPFTYRDGMLTVQQEYNDIDPAQVGKSSSFALQAKVSGLEDNNGKLWVKQKTAKQDLDGLWRISGRQQDNNMTTIPRGDRKTIKLLVDGYFQWIAINPAVKGFYGTGGGKYTFTNGKYNEHILFFSRDNMRVGAQLTFDGTVQNGQWHHSGLSSKGDPIHEIWSRDK